MAIFDNRSHILEVAPNVDAFNEGESCACDGSDCVHHFLQSLVFQPIGMAMMQLVMIHSIPVNRVFVNSHPDFPNDPAALSS